MGIAYPTFVIEASSLTLIPLRAKLAEKDNGYESNRVEITVARTLRGIMEGSMAT